MGTIRLTRQEIEAILSRNYLGKVIIYTDIRKNEVCGKVGRITCEAAIEREPMVIFSINHVRYECDVEYFIQNTKLCIREKNPGTTATGSG